MLSGYFSVSVFLHLVVATLNKDSMVSNIVITEFGRHYGSYIAGMHVRVSFLPFSYRLSTINCYAWTRVIIYSMLIGSGRGCETCKTTSWHTAALCVCHVLRA